VNETFEHYLTSEKFTVRPDPAAREDGLSKDESCWRRTGLRRSRFDKLSANGVLSVYKFTKYRQH
jgi:hypothetical protein